MIRQNKHLWISAAATMLVFLFQCPLFPQSDNPRATRWFKTGIEEPDPQKKIEAYLKAIEAEPLFVEALFNLGMVFLQQKDYENAERYLEKAASALTYAPSNLKANLRAKILYSYAGTTKKLGKIRETEEILLEAKDLHADKSMLSKISFELGRLLYEQNRYEEALQELRTGQDIDKESNQYFGNLITLIETEMQHRDIYTRAQIAYENENYGEALTLFKQINNANPEYRDVADKIKAIESHQRNEDENRRLADLYEEALGYSRQGNFEKAIDTFERLLFQEPSYQDAQVRLSQAREQLAQRTKNQQLERAYAKGITALKEKNWTAAIIAFEKVITLDPTYLDVQEKLAQANRGLENEGTETIITLYYSQAIDALEKNELGSALAALEKVRMLNPSYKQTRSLISKVERLLESRINANPSANDYFDNLYKQATAHIEAEQWMQAILTLEKLIILKPEDQEIKNLLSHARSQIKLAAPQNKTDRQPLAIGRPLIYAGWVLAAVVGLPFFGFLVFAPTNRARFCMMRGNYFKAAQIYERLLLRRPDKVKFYITLAQIYLMTGRSDERAIKVFQMLINLNLATHIHAQIRTVLTDKYLTDGRSNTDNEAIAVLESALKSEQQQGDE